MKLLIMITVNLVLAIKPGLPSPLVFKSQYICGTPFTVPSASNYFNVTYNFKFVQYFLINYNPNNTLLSSDRLVTLIVNKNMALSNVVYSYLLMSFFQSGNLETIYSEYYENGSIYKATRNPGIYYEQSNPNTRYKNFTRKENLDSWNRVEYYLQNSAINVCDEFYWNNSGNLIKRSRNINLKNIKLNQIHHNSSPVCNSFQYQLFVHIESISIDSYNVFNPMDSYFKPFENNILTRHNNNTVLYKYPTNQMTNMAPIYNNVISGNITITRNAIIPEIYPFQSSNNRFTTLSNSCHNITYSNSTVIVSPSDKSYKYSISVIVNYLTDFKSNNNYSNVTLYQRQLVNLSNLFSLQYSIVDSDTSTMSYTSINNYKTMTLISHITDISKLIGSFSYPNLNNRATYIIGVTDNIFQSSCPNYDWFVIKSLFIELIDSQSTFFEFNDYDTQSTTFNTNYYICPLRVSLLETSFFGGMDLDLRSTGIYNDFNNLVYSFDYGDNLNRYTNGNYNTVGIVDINSSNTVVNRCIDINCDICISRVCQYCSFGYYLLDGVCLLADDSCVYDKVNRICYSSYISLNSYTELIDYLSNAYNSILVINVKLTNIQSGNSYMWYIHSITDTETFPYIPNILPSTDATLIANLIETINDISSNQSLDIVSIKIISQDMSYVYSKFNPLEIFDNYLTYTTINQISNNYFNYMFVIPACEYLMQGSPVSMSCDVNCQYTDAYDNKIDCKENFQFNYQQFLNDISYQNKKSTIVFHDLILELNTSVSDIATSDSNLIIDSPIFDNQKNATVSLAAISNIFITFSFKSTVDCPTNCLICSNSDICNTCLILFYLDVKNQCVLEVHDSFIFSFLRGNGILPDTVNGNIDNNIKKSKSKSLSLKSYPVSKIKNNGNLKCTPTYVKSTGEIACKSICVCSSQILESFALLKCPYSIIDPELLKSLTYSDLTISLYSSSLTLSELMITPIAPYGQLIFNIPSKIDATTSPCYFSSNDMYTLDFQVKPTIDTINNSVLSSISTVQYLSIFGSFSHPIASVLIFLFQFNKLFYFMYFTDINKTSFIKDVNNSLYSINQSRLLLSDNYLSLCRKSQHKLGSFQIYPSLNDFFTLFVVEVIIYLFIFVKWLFRLNNRLTKITFNIMLSYQKSLSTSLSVFILVFVDEFLILYRNQASLIKMLILLILISILIRMIIYINGLICCIFMRDCTLDASSNKSALSAYWRFEKEKALLGSYDLLTILLFVSVLHFLRKRLLLTVPIICCFEILKIFVYFCKVSKFGLVTVTNYVSTSILLIAFSILSMVPVQNDKFEFFANTIYIVVNLLCLTKLILFNLASVKNILVSRKTKSIINNSFN